jgi:hypothetical protein
MTVVRCLAWYLPFASGQLTRGFSICEFLVGEIDRFLSVSNVNSASLPGIVLLRPRRANSHKRALFDRQKSELAGSFG